MGKIRLYVDQPLGREQSVNLSRDQAHYLSGVMRQEVGAVLSLFNGQDGEWRGVVTQLGKRGGTLRCDERTRPLQMPPDVWLLFAPIKKTRTDFIVEKATELGAARICPVGTDFTNSDRIRQDRLQAHAIEAAQQCGGTYVPQVEPLVPLARMLDAWPADRQLMFCDETTVDGAPAVSQGQPGPWAVLIGPEGGFSPAERARLHAMDRAHVANLGPRILRADTAAVAALTLWQARYGDWK